MSGEVRGPEGLTINKDDGKSMAKPAWLKVRAGTSPNYEDMAALVRQHRLHTVCEEADCPNKFECYGKRTATFILLGPTCTRNCRYCAVSPGKPTARDLSEPERVVRAISQLSLQYAVITSVTRDDLPDGGAWEFSEVVRKMRALDPGCRVEVLTPDFSGSISALQRVVAEKPAVFSHNVETVSRLFPAVRPQADYDRSVLLLADAKKIDRHQITKSGIMVGLGETYAEIIDVLRDLRETECDILTIGQYLRPSTSHIPVTRYYPLEEFETLKREALQIGFRYVESGPLVRSSYNASSQLEAIL